MKTFFRCFMAALLLLAGAGVVRSITTADPWPHETRNSVLGLAFFASVWAGTEVVAKARGKW